MDAIFTFPPCYFNDVCLCLHVFVHQFGYYKVTTNELTFIICFIAGEKSEPQQFRKYLHIPGVFYNNRRESI
jgi:hypothetical protein